MAESNKDNEMPNVPDDLAGGKTDEEKDKDRARYYVNLARNVTTKIAAHVFQVEMSVKEREQLCKCVNNIIAAYEKKLQEVKGLNDVIRVMKRKSKEKSRKIKQFKQINAELRAQLASSLCQKCGQGRVTEMIRSLSMEYSIESDTEVDGLEVENQEIEGNETDFASVSNEGGQLTCPHAGCGFIAFVCLFNKMDINFCPLKFIQKFGAVTRHKTPSCTEIINEMKKLNFIQTVHSCDIKEGNHEEKLNEIAQKLIDTEQKAGLLWYSTEETKHCVTVHVTVTGTQMEIVDAQLNQNYITDLPSVREFMLFVLKCDSNGESLIKKNWDYACNTEICKTESQQLSKAGNSLPRHNDSKPGV